MIYNVTMFTDEDPLKKFHMIHKSAVEYIDHYAVWHFLSGPYSKSTSTVSGKMGDKATSGCSWKGMQ